MKVVSPTYRPPLPPTKFSCYSFLLEAESTPGSTCGRKDYVNEKFQWHYRESNPRPSGLYCSAGLRSACLWSPLRAAQPQFNLLLATLYVCPVQKCWKFRHASPVITELLTSETVGPFAVITLRLQFPHTFLTATVCEWRPYHFNLSFCVEVSFAQFLISTSKFRFNNVCCFCLWSCFCYGSFQFYSFFFLAQQQSVKHVKAPLATWPKHVARDWLKNYCLQLRYNAQ
jgi:hypothetical protein